MDVPRDIAKTFLPEDDPAIAGGDGAHESPPFVTFMAVKRNNAILDILCALQCRRRGPSLLLLHAAQATVDLTHVPPFWPDADDISEWTAKDEEEVSNALGRRATLI